MLINQGLVCIKKKCEGAILQEKIKVIEEIRQNYGFDLETNEHVKAIIDNLSEQLNRALEELSKGLYSKETHFIMELIQNADDNKYNSDNPKIIFIYDTEKMIIKNNEIGFNDDDVKAICAVGKSNKKKNSECIYIGEKGIGFKSIFKITNKPQIYSNCFRFEFRKKDKQNKLGFVVPYWIEPKPDFIDENETTIVLPFNDEFKAEITKFEAAKDPMLLIFLNKLVKLEICDKVKNEHHFFEKINNIDGSFIIKHNKKYENGFKEEKFFWKKNDFWINTKDIDEEKRNDIQRSRMILAFPLNEDGIPRIELQRIFAFLPLEQTPEFKFVIQADFLLTSNREDIAEKLWNRRLRDNINEAFIDSLKIFQNDEKLRTTWYSYIPKENEIHNPFFKSVVEEIYEKLKDSKCIFTASGTWEKPPDTILASSEIQHLIPANINGKQYYVHTEIKEKKLIEKLGVNVQKEYSLILTALNKIEFLKSKDKEWFNDLYKFLYYKVYDTKEWKDKEIEISELPIIKGENGCLEVPSSLFFKSENEQLKEYEQIPVLKYVDIDGISETGKAFLKNIGVHPHILEEIKNYIIKAYKSKDCESWSPEQHRNCSKYIETWLNQKKWDISDSEKDELGLIRIHTGNEWKPANECYFPDEELKIILPEDASFVRLLKNDDDERRFLRTIGVWPIPRIIIKQEISIINTHEISDIEKYAEWLDKNNHRAKDNPAIEEWCIYILEGFENCIVKKELNISIIFLKFLIDNWEYYYLNFIKSNYQVYYKTHPVPTKPIQVPSYFSYKIKQAEWLPTNKGIKKPDGVFRSFELKKLSPDFPCLEIEKELFNKGKVFFDFLDLGTSPDLKTLLKMLNNIKNKDDKNLIVEIYRRIALELHKAENTENFNKDFKDLHLLSSDDIFYPINELYRNDHPKAEYFKNVHFVYIPEELSGDKKLLFEDFFEIEGVSSAIESVLDKVIPDNEISPHWSELLKDRSDYIRCIFSYNDIENPDEFFKKYIRVCLADEIHVNHKLLDYTYPENVDVYCDRFTGTIYKKRDADELDLALGIEESVRGKNIAVYINSVLKLSEPTLIEDLLTRCGIKLLSENISAEKNHVIIAEGHEETEETQDEIGYPEIKESLAERVKRAYHETEQISSSTDDFKSQKQKWDYDNLDINIEADISPEIKHSKKRRRISSILIERKPAVTEKVKQWYGHKCQICGESFETKGGNRYAEGHHFIPIGDEKECEDIDHLGNVLCVCTKCHKMMHQGKWRSIGIDSNTKEWRLKRDNEGFFHLDLVFYGIFEDDNFYPEKNMSIKYNQRHLEHLKIFLELHGNKDKIIVEGGYF